MITNIREGLSKNGKPYAVVTVEDYSGSVELFLIGQRLLDNKAYIEDGLFVYVNGKVELNYRKKNEIKQNPNITPTDDDYEFSANKFTLLADVREKQCKGIELSFDISDINEEFITTLMSLLEGNSGKLGLNLKVNSADEDLSLSFLSRRFMVSSENDFLENLKKVPELEFKVLT